jgi:hypothetical protein
MSGKNNLETPVLIGRLDFGYTFNYIRQLLRVYTKMALSVKILKK